MNYQELINKFTKNFPSHFLICSKLGSGKTTFLNYLNAELANNYEKYNIIPLFVNASKITTEQGSFINYLISIYSDKISEKEKYENIDRKQIFKEYLNDNKYKFLLIIDSTELLYDDLDKDLVKELGEFNEFHSLSIIYSTCNNKRKAEVVFADYELIDDFGNLDEKQICRYLNKHGFNIDYINNDWCELLNTPFFLTKFTEVYENKDFNFSSNVPIVKSELIEAYFDELISINNSKTEGEEYNNRRQFLYIDIPELVFKNNSQRVILSAKYDVYMNTLSVLDVINDNMSSYECEVSHIIYFHFFEAKYIKNCFVNNSLEECVELLNQRIISDETLLYFGEQLKLTNENRKETKLYHCIEFIRTKCRIEEYQIAIGNILNVFINTCSEQLSDLDLSNLDLRNFCISGIECKNTDFSNCSFTNMSLVSNIPISNPRYIAVLNNGEYIVALTNNNGIDVCVVYNIKTNKINYWITKYRITSVVAVSENCYAISYYDKNNENDRVVHIDIYDSKRELVQYTLSFKYLNNFKLIQFSENVLFGLNEDCFYKIDITSGKIEQLNWIKYSDDYKIYSINKQFCLASYHYNNTKHLICTLQMNDQSIETKLEIRNCDIYFSETSPIIAIVSNINDDKTYYLWSFVTRSFEEIDDFSRQCGNIYCKKFFLKIGTEVQEGNSEFVFIDDYYEYLNSSNGYYVLKKGSKFKIFDSNEEIYSNFVHEEEKKYNLQIIEDKIYWCYFKDNKYIDTGEGKLIICASYDLTFDKIELFSSLNQRIDGFYKFGKYTVHVQLEGSDAFFFAKEFEKFSVGYCEKYDYGIYGLQGVFNRISDLSIYKIKAYLSIRESDKEKRYIYLTYDGYLIDNDMLNIDLPIFRTDYSINHLVIGAFFNYVFVFDYKENVFMKSIQCKKGVMPIEVWFEQKNDKYIVYIQNEKYFFDRSWNYLGNEKFNFKSENIIKMLSNETFFNQYIKKLCSNKQVLVIRESCKNPDLFRHRNTDFACSCHNLSSVIVVK